jgi:hypothetical protein
MLQRSISVTPFDIDTLFDPEMLKNGSDEEKSQQLASWGKSEYPSVFVRWVPDELLPNERANPPDHVARNFFGNFGEIDRIDFVAKFNEAGKQSGHMAFVHFVRIHDQDFASTVSTAYPQAADFDWTTRNRYGAERIYKLKCAVNNRPIARVEFNTIQLSDMFERLKAEMVSLRKEVTELTKENIELYNEIDAIQRRM